MQNNNVLDPNDIPQVAMDAMNAVHKEELTIVNQLSTAIAENNDSQITTLCDQWLAHTIAHFERENTLMKKYNFPAFKCHHGEHEEALIGLESIIDAWKHDANLATLSIYIKDVWPQWYIQHIATMDTVTSAFVKAASA